MVELVKPCKVCGYPRRWRRGGGGFGSGQQFTLAACIQCKVKKQKKRKPTDG